MLGLSIILRRSEAGGEAKAPLLLKHRCSRWFITLTITISVFTVGLCFFFTWQSKTRLFSLDWSIATRSRGSFWMQREVERIDGLCWDIEALPKCIVEMLRQCFNNLARAYQFVYLRVYGLRQSTSASLIDRQDLFLYSVVRPHYCDHSITLNPYRLCLWSRSRLYSELAWMKKMVGFLLLILLGTWEDSKHEPLLAF